MTDSAIHAVIVYTLDGKECSQTKTTEQSALALLETILGIDTIYNVKVDEWDYSSFKSDPGLGVYTRMHAAADLRRDLD